MFWYWWLFIETREIYGRYDLWHGWLRCCSWIDEKSCLKKSKNQCCRSCRVSRKHGQRNAQRPGDIVKSYSGKTIEVLNTDAEGRLVLADALTFTEKKYKPKFIIDLATLTGAIVSLGSEYAGLFSNDDKLSKQIFNAGENVGKKVWRMPLHKNYDKLMNSKNADIQNINYVGGAGSTTSVKFYRDLF